MTALHAKALAAAYVPEYPREVGGGGGGGVDVREREEEEEPEKERKLNKS